MAVDFFKRKEKKYLITTAQMQALLLDFGPYITQSEFFQSKVTSVYYDNDTYDLIHLSAEHPKYKEKFRTRSYQGEGNDNKCFAEIKKKLNGIVYKRRVGGSFAEIEALINQGEIIEGESKQVQEEILWMIKRYELKPQIWISCQRLSYEGIEDKELRITFDSNLVYQIEEPSLNYKGEGNPVIDKDFHIMEIKYYKGAPRWLVDTLNKYKLYPQAFSKVAHALDHIIKGDK